MRSELVKEMESLARPGEQVSKDGICELFVENEGVLSSQVGQDVIFSLAVSRVICLVAREMIGERIENSVTLFAYQASQQGSQGARALVRTSLMLSGLILPGAILPILVLAMLMLTMLMLTIVGPMLVMLTWLMLARTMLIPGRLCQLGDDRIRCKGDRVTIGVGH